MPLFVHRVSPSRASHMQSGDKQHCKNFGRRRIRTWTRWAARKETVTRIIVIIWGDTMVAPFIVLCRSQWRSFNAHTHTRIHTRTHAHTRTHTHTQRCTSMHTRTLPIVVPVAVSCGARVPTIGLGTAPKNARFPRCTVPYRTFPSLYRIVPVPYLTVRYGTGTVRYEE